MMALSKTVFRIFHFSHDSYIAIKGYVTKELDTMSMGRSM
jgi:hypothetical protein